jgi:hypothetical protein
MKWKQDKTCATAATKQLTHSSSHLPRPPLHYSWCTCTIPTHYLSPHCNPITCPHPTRVTPTSSLMLPISHTPSPPLQYSYPLDTSARSLLTPQPLGPPPQPSVSQLPLTHSTHQYQLLPMLIHQTTTHKVHPPHPHPQPSLRFTPSSSLLAATSNTGNTSAQNSHS